MGSAESELEGLFNHNKKPIKNPLVPISPSRTLSSQLVSLTAGLITFRRVNSQLGQKLMRARVVSQGATVALMFGAAYHHYGDKF